MRIIERIIEIAMNRGAFKGLRGEGKPLQLDENPFTSPEDRLTHHLLREQGFSLPWVEEWREIEQEIARMRDRHERVFVDDSDKKMETEKVYRQEVERINIKIRDYNLKVPLPQFQKPLLKVDK